MTDDYKERRAWFEGYAARCNAGVIAAPRPGVRYPCPCCGYPMLGERGGYEICSLCNWEDDGQDDPHADEVWGGPNGSYSLSQARNNFRTRLSMYDPERPDGRTDDRDRPRGLEAKRQIMTAFDGMRDARNQQEVAELWEAVEVAERVLVSELQRSAWGR